MTRTKRRRNPSYSLRSKKNRNKIRRNKIRKNKLVGGGLMNYKIDMIIRINNEKYIIYKIANNKLFLVKMDRYDDHLILSKSSSNNCSVQQFATIIAQTEINKTNEVNKYLREINIETCKDMIAIEIANHLFDFPSVKNCYIAYGHGLSEKYNDYVDLKNNEFVVCVCRRGDLYYRCNWKGWHHFLQSKTIDDYYKLIKEELIKEELIKEDKFVSNQLCIYINKCPNMKLYFAPQGKYDAPNLRFGVYKLPLEISLDCNIKKQFLKKNQNMEEYSNKYIETFSKYIQAKNLVQHNFHTCITSYKKYDNIIDHGYHVDVRSLLSDIRKNDNNTEDNSKIIFLYVCRTILGE